LVWPLPGSGNSARGIELVGHGCQRRRRFVGDCAGVVVYVREPRLAPRTARSLGIAYQLALNKFHFDELYGFFIVAPLSALAEYVVSSICISWTAWSI